MWPQPRVDGVSLELIVNVSNLIVLQLRLFRRNLPRL